MFGSDWHPVLALFFVFDCNLVSGSGIRFWHYSSLNIVIVFKLSRLADDLLWYLWRWLVSGSRIFSTGWYSILASWALTDILHWHLSHWLASGSGVLFRCNRSRFIQVLLTLFFFVRLCDCLVAFHRKGLSIYLVALHRGYSTICLVAFHRAIRLFVCGCLSLYFSRIASWKWIGSC